MPQHHEMVVPQPKQPRPVGPHHDGHAPNPGIMTMDQVAAVRERHYPKWMYHPTEEPLLVKDAAVEETLGVEWQEEPVIDPATLERPAVPATREEYYKLGQAQVLEIIASCDEPAKLQTMMTSESAHPRRPSGRPQVLEAIADRIADLEMAARGVTQEQEPPAKKRGR